MNRKQKLFENITGFSFIEIIIAAAIASLVLGTVTKLYMHFSSQGLQQDRQTIFWSTYCRMMEAIREDLNKAAKVDYSDPAKIVISIVEIDNTYCCSLGTITWNIQDKKKVVRISESGALNVFHFSGGLVQSDILQMNFRKAP